MEAAHFFEGTEKLLEVWFSWQQPDANQGSGHLHTIPRHKWDILLKDSRVINQPDQTLEILMSELDPAVMDQCYMKYGITAKDVTHESRICDLIPGSVIDATLFDPCGYSMNGMKSDGTYWTIHITPEPEFCVSFETNLSQTSYDDLIRKVVEVFKPGKFVTTLFADQSSKCHTVLSLPQKTESFKGLDCQSALFSDYNFVFTSFAKKHQQQQS
ncbi:S-adenosylmethionine decarboxylase proenzyme-like [Mesoplodon densirostris]|uniref:S-adenosylmethionine decarboxylase proenzyme-like n=1 Tax=Mesoplodon densirostris TaxID=48708 RepID=UPI0028DCE873|nr:S-adenosylmethionine decarboxylase proenzyme-like [Mesoplodon densirostris]